MFERATEIQTECSWLGFSPKYPQQLGLCQADARSPELNLFSHVSGRDPSTQAIICWLPSRKLERKWKKQDLNQGTPLQDKSILNSISPTLPISHLHHSTFCLYRLTTLRTSSKWIHAVSAQCNWIISVRLMSSRFIHAKTCIKVLILLKMK